ncbi:MAG: dTMP kinase [Ignavibacteria bacterium]|nr:dTMP kinase [Ignavibacteria bacterium]
MFITFEGIDGSGKSTQLTMLREWLEAQNKSAIVVREPGATKLSEELRAILLSNKHTITSTAELLLFSAARTQLVEKVIRPALERGDIVLCDRYVDSTTAYQGYGRQLDMAEVEACNRIAVQGLMPVVTFFIDVPYEEAQQRMQFLVNSAEPDRMERSGKQFFDRVRQGYLTIAHQEPTRFVVVDGVRPAEAIHLDIIQQFQSVSLRF